MANHIPDEIVSEILSPLLKLPGQVFSDTSAKPLTAPGYSSSTYLLVCKSWLRVATPLLYNVVILRTTAQANALSNVLLNNPEIGPFIRKLRVEGGFGSAMLRILRSSPNITDLFLSLIIWSSDRVGGLCEGLASINPRRVIVVDGNLWTNPKPMKNQEVANLLKSLTARIPKWDKLEIFHFPYVERRPRPFHPTSSTLLLERAKMLASALAQSKSLETLLVIGYDLFPEYFLPMSNVPSLKCIRIQLPFINLPFSSHVKQFQLPSKLKAIVEFDEPTETNPTAPLAAEDTESGRTRVTSTEELKTLSRSNSASTTQWLDMNLYFDPTPPRKSWTAKNPVIIAPFTAVTRLVWSTPPHFFFPTPAAGFTAFPQVTSLNVWKCTPPVLDFFTQLSLDQLRIVTLGDHAGDVASAVAFVRQHRTKLTQLSVPLKVLVQSKVFDTCSNLETVTLERPRSKEQRASIRTRLHSSVFDHAKTIPDDLFTCAVPHAKLTKICLGYYAHSVRQDKAILTRFFRTLDNTNFPALKEIPDTVRYRFL